jgi:peptidoglycan/xylan/chitin deacetylase (PgdA/CDA1 family)
MSRQRALASLLRNTGITALRLRHYPHRLPVLAYHRILDDDTDPATLPDPGLFSARLSDFRRQLQWLTRYFDCVTFQGLTRHAARQRPPLIITFDDGYEDNYRLAWPALRDAGAAAVFFVTTDFIDQHRPLWFDRASHALRSSGNTLPEDLLRRLPPARPDENLLQRCLLWLKSLDQQQREQMLVRLERHGNIASAPSGTPMNWDQLREMAASGMEIGSHSCSHAVLANETPAQIRAELSQSKLRIESETGQPCQSIAYPVGGDTAISDEVVAEARHCGYAYACSYVSGMNSLPPVIPWRLNRLHVELDQSDAELSASIAFPSLFGYRRR